MKIKKPIRGLGSVNQATVVPNSNLLGSLKYGIELLLLCGVKIEQALNSVPMVTISIISFVQF